MCCEIVDGVIASPRVLSILRYLETSVQLFHLLKSRLSTLFHLSCSSLQTWAENSTRWTFSLTLFRTVPGFPFLCVSVSVCEQRRWIWSLVRRPFLVRFFSVLVMLTSDWCSLFNVGSLFFDSASIAAFTKIWSALISSKEIFTWLMWLAICLMAAPNFNWKLI